ncbi:MAG: hypothetical protein IPL74_08010 [Bacteroidetes bacterium]|nr:hypothetical protein [Bacteroidota bacterium]
MKNNLYLRQEYCFHPDKNAATPVIAGVGNAFTLIDVDAGAMQPLASVTVTVTGPATPSVNV